MKKTHQEQQVVLNDSELKEELFSEQLHFLFKNLLVSVPSSLICAIITFTALYRIPHTMLLEFWFISLLVISAIRLGFAFYYLHDNKASRTRYYLFLFLLTITAILWGIVSFFLIPENYPIEQLITVIVLAGITAGGVQSLQASLVASLLYTFIILAPLCAWAYSHNTFTYNIFGFAITFYLLFTMVISIRGYKFLHQTLLLKYENIGLAQAVQNEKEFLNTILDNLKEGIIAFDSRGNLTVFNAALRKKLNISEIETLSPQLLNNFEFYMPSNKKTSNDSQPYSFDFLNGSSLKSTEFYLKLKDGQSMHAIINQQPIIKANGDRVGTVTIIYDITEIKQSELIKNEFVAVVSHELRTPLTSIQGSLGLLMSGVAGVFSDKAKKLISIANNNCSRLLLLINDILDIDKLEEGKMKFNLKMISVNHILEEAILNDKMYGKKFDVNLELQSLKNDVEIYVDPDRLLQVISNLISNAVKFSPPHETVSVKVNADHHFVHISVTDKGSGIPNEFKLRIFQKFSQADSSDSRNMGGTGLGLAISKAIVEKLGGLLDFESKPGETIFSVHLPISHQSSTEISNKEIKNVV